MAKKTNKLIDSFKRELGKNTGKYLSNQLFGDKHSTPHTIIHKGRIGRNGKSDSSGTEESESSVDDEIKYEVHQEKVYQNRMEQVSSIQFKGDNVDEISNQLDNLIVYFNGADVGEWDYKAAIRTKAISGAMKLERLGERELAKYYRKQLPNPKLIRYTLIALLAIVSFGGLVFIALGGLD
ncbi:MAG: hypothetical protein COB15_11110 [Flavobacteriales bacterium]|nr:MAG: hypothetical protein COB15_11110 [Flavobacteriales bacterium]